MPDYSKACIYKIKHLDDFDDENIYIGATCNLIRRRNRHKNLCNNPNNKEYNRNVYKYIRDNGGWEQFIVFKISDFSCKSKSELNIEERRYLDLMKPKLNMIKSYVSKEEAYERDKEISRKYRMEHKEEKSIQNKVWYLKNKEKVIERVHTYYQNNKEKIAEKEKIKYQRNKEKIKENRKEKTTCECGCEIQKDHLSRHKRTQKHIDLMNKKNLANN